MHIIVTQTYKYTCTCSSIMHLFTCHAQPTCTCSPGPWNDATSLSNTMHMIVIQTHKYTCTCSFKSFNLVEGNCRDGPAGHKKKWLLYLHVQDFFIREDKESILPVKYTASGVYGPQEFLFRPSEIAFGGLWIPRRLVTEVLLHVGGISHSPPPPPPPPPPCCMKPWRTCTY